MRSTRFFRMIWRINGIVFLLGGIISLVLFGALIVDLIQRSMRHTSTAVVKMEGPSGIDLEKLELGDFKEIPGTSYLRAELATDDQGAVKGFGSSGSFSSTRNYLFFNTENLQSHWLFPDNKRLIIDSKILYETPNENATQNRTHRAIAISYQIADVDSDGDKLITSNDQRSLAYSRPDGQGYTTAMKGFNRLLYMQLEDLGTRHVVVYQIEGKWQAATISLLTFKVEKTVEISVR